MRISRGGSANALAFALAFKDRINYYAYRSNRRLFPVEARLAAKTVTMVIEFLTFNVEPSERAEWLPIEEATWSRYLEKRPGFIRKEMWTNRENPLEVHAVVWWTDWETWQTVPEEDIVEVDAAMGTWFRISTSMKVFDVIREC